MNKKNTRLRNISLIAFVLAKKTNASVMEIVKRVGHIMLNQSGSVPVKRKRKVSCFFLRDKSQLAGQKKWSLEGSK